MLIKTGLYVITGGPGTGKTSLIEELKIVGYQTVKRSSTGYYQRTTATGWRRIALERYRFIYQYDAGTFC